MDYLAKWFNVISLKDLIEWLDGRKNLPPFAALITFDDGYLDNYLSAYPILRQHNFPALIFLTTEHIGTDAHSIGIWRLTVFAIRKEINLLFHLEK